MLPVTGLFDYERSIVRDMLRLHQKKEQKYKKVTVVLGAQWGDEGKGKLVDHLAEEADVVCRCQGGNNAGHTVVVDGREYEFHVIPCGILREECVVVLGNGTVLHVPQVIQELERLGQQGIKDWFRRIVISDKAHLVFDFHQQVDAIQEREKGDKSLGTTKKGIGPAYSCKATRNGIRVVDLVGDFDQFAEKYRTLATDYQRMFPELEIDIEGDLEKYRGYGEWLRPLVKETISYIHKSYKSSNKIVVEGANAAMLDIDFGTYPYVTSSNCTIGGVCTGLGIPPSYIGEVIGVVKAYMTRVGDGPFPTELKNTIGEYLQGRGKEVGVTTKRKRRCGWLDLMVLRYSTMINGYTALCITKLDVLDELPEIKIGVSYELDGSPIEHIPTSPEKLSRIQVVYKSYEGWLEPTSHITDFNKLPIQARRYVRLIEDVVGVPVKWLGVGKDRKQMIIMPESKIHENLLPRAEDFED